MKFEEALAQMRLGAKITNPYLEDDVYFQACRISLMGEDFGVSIVKMKGDFKHPDMGCGSIDDMLYPGTFILKEEIFKTCKHGYLPQLDLLLVMNEDWCLYE